MGNSPLEGYLSHPPPHRVENPRSLHVEKARMQDAVYTGAHICNIGRKIQTRNWDAERGEGGENNTKLNNSLMDQHFEAGFYTKIATTYLLLIALTNLLLASLASKNRVLYSEGRAYKREPELAASPQSTTLHSTGNTSVKNGVSRTKSATATHVE